MNDTTAPPNRRRFLKLAGTAAAALYLPTTAQAAGLVTRSDISTLASNSATLNTLRAGITAMKNLPSSNGWNWQRVANTHQNFCAHNNWFFLPWHRPYLGFLEYVIQQLTGTPNFGLPYWNWTRNPSVPAVCWNGVLLDGSRQVNGQTRIPSGYCDNGSMNTVMAASDFNSFASAVSTDQWGNAGAGRLEGTPHNCVHWWMGGDMNTYMSPLDPVFWLHHGNIDRLWATWNQNHQNPGSTSPWFNYGLQYDLFNGWHVYDTVSTPTMGYQYDRLGI